MDSLRSPNNIKAQLLAFATVCLWASAFVYTSVALEYFSPLSLGFVRYGIASLILIIVGLVKRVGLPKRRDIGIFLLLGLFGFALFITLFNIGMATISASLGSIIIATAPIFTALASLLFLKEMLSKLQWVAVFIEFCGILILNFPKGAFTFNIGIVWVLAAALSFSGYNLLMRKISKSYTPLQATIYCIVSGTIFLGIFAPSAIRELKTANLSTILVAIELGLLPSAIGYLLWAKALFVTTKTSDVTNFMFVTPLLATGLDYIVTGKVAESSTIFGGIVVLMGLMMFNRFRSATVAKAS